MNRFKYIALTALICCGSQALAMNEPSGASVTRDILVLIADGAVTQAIQDPTKIVNLAQGLTFSVNMPGTDTYCAHMAEIYLERFLYRNRPQYVPTFARELRSRIDDGSISSTRKTAILDVIKSCMQESNDTRLINAFAQFLIIIDPTES